MAANRLTELPKSLGGLMKLKVLKCGKNPWKKDMVVPKNVLSKGDEATLAYLRNLFTSGEAYMNRMKCVLLADVTGLFIHSCNRLMFVGNGNVGKTSLLASFKKQKTGPNVATDGIDISEWAPDERITFNAWDFAGQEVYYATHSFFLSPQAIYIIVFNMLDDEHANKIECAPAFHSDASLIPIHTSRNASPILFHQRVLAGIGSVRSMRGPASRLWCSSAHTWTRCRATLARFSATTCRASGRPCSRTSS